MVYLELFRAPSNVLYSKKRLLRIIEEETDDTISDDTFKKDKDVLGEQGFEFEYLEKEHKYKLKTTEYGLQHEENLYKLLRFAHEKGILLSSPQDFRDLQRIITFDPQEQPVSQGYFQTLRHAISNRKTIQFEYVRYRVNVQTPKVHEVEPYQLLQRDNRWYLVAFNPKRDNYTAFAIERMKDLKTVDNFDYRADFDIQQLQRDYYGVYFGSKEPITEMVLRFPSKQRRFIESTPLHVSQKTIREYKDGSADIYLRTRIERQLVMRILQYGERVEVFSPATLRTLIRQELQHALKIYSSVKQ